MNSHVEIEMADDELYEGLPIPSTEKGPRSTPEGQQQTGVGTPRSADGPTLRPGADIPEPREDLGVDPSVVVGATTDSHPAAADDVDINRSGSGGTGGPGTDESDDAGGNQP